MPGIGPAPFLATYSPTFGLKPTINWGSFIRVGVGGEPIKIQDLCEMRGLVTEGSKAVGSVIRLASGLMKMFASNNDNESCLAWRRISCGCFESSSALE